VTAIARGWYDDLDQAGRILRDGLSVTLLRLAELTKRGFLQSEYTNAAPASGHLLGFASDQVERIAMPRPSALRMRQHGWGVERHGGIGGPRRREEDKDTSMIRFCAASSKTRQWRSQVTGC
jgi:hypothetical protein